MYEIKTEGVYRDLSSNKKLFGFSNYLTKSKYYDDSNKLVIGKMKDETRGVATEKFVELKPKMYSILLDDNSEPKKAKGVNRNVVVTTIPNGYKVVLLNNKCIRHSVNRIQGKGQRTGTYEINKILLSCFDDKTYIQNNGYDGLALGYYN